MTNIIRADIYRIIRGKSLYIISLLVVLFGLMVVIAATLTDATLPFVNASPEALELNGINSAGLLFSNGPMLTFLLIPLVMMVAGPIFTDGTAKNEIAWGISRTRLYTARLIIVTVVCGLMLLVYLTAGMIFATILRGFGDYIPYGYWFNIIKTIVLQSFMFSAASWMGIFLIFTIKSGYAFVEVFMGVMVAPTLIAVLFMNANIDLSRVLDFDITTNIGRLGAVADMDTRGILMALVVGAVWMVIPTIIGLIRFQKAEIK